MLHVVCCIKNVREHVIGNTIIKSMDRSLCCGRFVPFDQFGREVFIGDGTGRIGGVLVNRFAKAGGLTEADIARDNGAEYFAGEEVAHLFDDLAAEIGAFVIHGHNQAANLNVRVEVMFNHIDRVVKLG